MRDMDLIRELLLKIEGGQTSFEAISGDGASFLGIETETFLTREQADKLSSHLDLLEQAGFIEIAFRSLGGTLIVKRITWQGYDFLDSIRDPEVWRKTKEGASKAGSWTVQLLVEVSKAYAKQKLKEVTGLDLA
jgi:hypothetical protein